MFVVLLAVAGSSVVINHIAFAARMSSTLSPIIDNSATTTTTALVIAAVANITCFDPSYG